MANLALTGSSYQVINLLTGALIVMVLGYSTIFSPRQEEYPVKCVHMSLYGDECQTCGLSRSFSEMARGDYLSASDYNRNGPLLFAFFVLQLFMRVSAGLAVSVAGREKYSQSGQAFYNSAGPAAVIRAVGTERKIRIIGITDGIVSFVLFLICFRYLLVFWQ